MATGDGLLVRVKPPGACLSAAQARVLAAAAARFGTGVIELTQRGNLQVRGLSPDGAAPFAAAMVAAGLGLAAGPESRRAVLSPPLLGADPGLAADAGAFTARLAHVFASDARLAALPGKFAVQVDAGGVLGGRPAAASLVAWTDGRRTGLRAGTRQHAPVLAGALPYPGTADGAFALAPPFAQLDAAMLGQLARLAERWATTLRVTPWRAILLARVPSAAPVAEAAGPDWITDAADPRLRIVACVGAPGCSSATVPARADAARLALADPSFALAFGLATRASAQGRGGLPLVHVSGCAKGCAHPGPAALTFTGRNGRYDVRRDGRAQDEPHAAGLLLQDILGS